ncbi:MAG: phosphate acyltransferase PlsX [Bacteroidetes bacterium]|nr:phosphate acyltransferase PlsX [Bacteroidota bacterium]
MKIGIDAMGGDFAPAEAVKGAYLAQLAHPEWKLVLFGKAAEIEAVCTAENLQSPGWEVVDCPQIVEMSEHPVRALASKPDSSIMTGFRHLAEGRIDAWLSAGNTGAMLVGSLQSVKAVEGILRPCLTSVLPRMNNNPGLLLDVGANADCKPEHIQQFAVLGSLFYSAVYGVSSPKVGLLNLGEEEEKGSILTRAAHGLLKNTAGIRFEGNVEGRDIFSDAFDVVVCDGFTGNVIIKVCEGMYYRLAKRGIQDEYLDKFNFKHYGGSAILGVNAPVIVGHGISKADTFVKMIEMAAAQVQNKLVEKIRESLAGFGSTHATA